jgi:hypothetical protein
VTDIVMLTAAGLSLGAMYALVALGFSVIYRASRVFNFAHGELLAIGAFTMASLTDMRVPWVLALVASMLITGVVAMGIERAVVRPMIGRPVFVTIILTLFVALLLRALSIVIWGVQPKSITSPLGESAVAARSRIRRSLRSSSRCSRSACSSSCSARRDSASGCARRPPTRKSRWASAFPSAACSARRGYSRACSPVSRACSRR